MKGRILAVDAVLIPSPEIAELAISLSKKLRNHSPFVLDGANYFPHITLAMGYVSNLQKTREELRLVFSKIGAFTITVEQIVRSNTDFNGHYFYSLSVRKNPKLQSLHEELIDTFSFLDVGEPPYDAFIMEEKEKITQAVTNYVNSFKKKASRKNYWPHITLGAGPLGILSQNTIPVKLPRSINVDNIGLFQLGNYCTCRKRLS